MSSNDPVRILLVEDEPEILTVTWLALDAMGGFTVEMCGSGGEALEKVAASPPDLLLMDVMMPGLSGPAVLEILRADPTTASLPVIFMTARVQPDEVEEYRALGALGVISKPFDPMTLSATVQRLWEKHHEHVAGRLR